MWCQVQGLGNVIKNENQSREHDVATHSKLSAVSNILSLKDSVSIFNGTFLWPYQVLYWPFARDVTFLSRKLWRPWRTAEEQSNYDKEVVCDIPGL